MKRLVLALAALSVPAVALPATGTLWLDDYWYTIQLDVPMSWTHPLTRLDLPSTAMNQCLRANGNPPLSGAIEIRYGAGPQSIFANEPVRVAANAPQIRILSVSGDLVCTGGTLSPILFQDGLE